MGDTNQCTDNSCQEKKQCCDKSSGCEMTDMMMKIAHSAWEDMMKQKIVKVFEAKMGKKMDKAASAIAGASMEAWQHKMIGKAKCDEHKEKIKAAFM